MASRRLFGSAALLLGAAAAVCVAACGTPKQKHVQRCDCEYLTDMDVPGTLAIVVCAESESRARELASDCGTALGVGQVTTCSCTPTTEACAGGLCEQAAARD